MSDAVLKLGGVEKVYNRGSTSEINVLRGASMEIEAGEVVALVAPSGAGKSTLLHIAGLLDTPDHGTVEVAGQNLNGASDRRRTRTRRSELGFIYQFHHLLPEFSALENVVLPQRANGMTPADAEARAQAEAARLEAERLAQEAEEREAARLKAERDAEAARQRAEADAAAAEEAERAKAEADRLAAEAEAARQAEAARRAQEEHRPEHLPFADLRPREICDCSLPQRLAFWRRREPDSAAMWPETERGQSGTRGIAWACTGAKQATIWFLFHQTRQSV